MKSPKTDFVHLHVHTQYRLLDGMIRINDLIKKARELNMPAIAMTNHGNLFGAIEFYQQAKHAGIKPIIGCELYVAPKSRFDKSASRIEDDAHHLIVLAKDMQGYKNLLRLTTAGYIEGFCCCPRVDKEILQACYKGLIATSACLRGEVSAYILKGDRDAAIKAAREYQKIFGKGNFYLEIMENGLPKQKMVNKGILEISRLLSIPVVATNDCHYLQAGDAEAYAMLHNIQAGKTIADKNRKRFETHQLYLRTPEEMKRLFSYCPEAISNTVVIAEKCNLKLELSHSQADLERTGTLDDRHKELIHNSIKGILSKSGAKSTKERRAAIVRYLGESFGKDHVARIITFRKMRARAVIRFVGKAMNMPDTEIDAITKMIPKVSNIFLRDAIDQEPRLQKIMKRNEKMRKLFSLSQALEGMNSQSSIHPTHVVVSDSSLINTVPLFSSKDELVAQYSRADLQALGLEIFDLYDC